MKPQIEFPNCFDSSWINNQVSKLALLFPFLLRAFRKFVATIYSPTRDIVSRFAIPQKRSSQWIRDGRFTQALTGFRWQYPPMDGKFQIISDLRSFGHVAKKRKSSSIFANDDRINYLVCEFSQGQD